MIRDFNINDVEAVAGIGTIGGHIYNKKSLKQATKENRIFVVESKEIVIGYCIYNKFISSVIVDSWGAEESYTFPTVIEQIVTRLVDMTKKKKFLQIPVFETELDTHIYLRDLGFRAEVNKKDNEIYDFSYTPDVPTYIP